MKKNARIMIVEDEAIIALELKRNLVDLGYCVQSIVCSGMECLNLIDKIAPDLILLDVNLPGDFDGIETAQIIYKLYEIPIIICTAHRKTEIIKKTYDCHPSGFLFKPYDDTMIKQEIESAFIKYEQLHN